MDMNNRNIKIFLTWYMIFLILVTIIVTIYKIWLHKMKHKHEKAIFLSIGIITGFIFVVVFSSVYVYESIQKNSICQCLIPIPYMIVILSSLGLFVGSISYYYLSGKLKNKSSNLKVTLSFLESDERRVVGLLIKQKLLRPRDIEKSTGMHKVKIHRLLKRLENRGVIRRESQQVMLNHELEKVFQ